MKNITLTIIAVIAVIAISCNNGGYEEEKYSRVSTPATAIDTSLISWDGGLTEGVTSCKLNEVKGDMKIPLNFKWRGALQGRNIILLAEKDTLCVINSSILEDDNFVLSGRHPDVCLKATGFTSYEVINAGSPYDKEGETSLDNRSKITIHYPEGCVEITIIDEF